jgi:hypothetical protein
MARRKLSTFERWLKDCGIRTVVAFVCFSVMLPFRQRSRRENERTNVTAERASAGSRSPCHP